MFESDDFDQVLSQLDFPDVTTNPQECLIPSSRPATNNSNERNSNSVKAFKFISPPSGKSLDKVNGLDNTNTKTCIALKKVTVNSVSSSRSLSDCNKNNNTQLQNSFNNHQSLLSSPPHPNLKDNYNANHYNTNSIDSQNVSPKHAKRKIINSHFDHNAKRKFPGPAGLLSGNFEEDKDETICHMELLSQDIDMSQNFHRRDLFESQLWKKLLCDLNNFNFGAIDSIKTVKQQALTGNLRRRKAQTITAFVETVDRSATDPLIILRDTSGSIKCTLHRDAWSTFSPYIASEYCAIVLRKPTVLTTGSAFKKHYLNITLSNIHAIYSSAILKEDTDSKPLPNGYEKNCEEDLTIISALPVSQNIGNPIFNESIEETSHLLDDLDNIFSDDVF